MGINTVVKLQWVPERNPHWDTGNSTKHQAMGWAQAISNNICVNNDNDVQQRHSPTNGISSMLAS